MTAFTDQKYLRDDQYRNAANLNARVALHTRFGTNPHSWHSWVYDQWDLPPDGRILELGCGAGWLWRENADRLPPGWAVTLSDFSPGMLDEARRGLADAGRPFAFAVLDAQAIPFADATFDAVIANHMLYHVPDKGKALAEIRRVLTPGGRLYAATNGEGHMRELFDLAQRFGLPRFNSMDPTSAGFRLENGRELLEPYFAHIAERRQPSGLRVTEAAPLIDYLLSGVAGSSLNEAKVEELRQCVEQEVADKGAMDIAKSSGMFIAA